VGNAVALVLAIGQAYLGLLHLLPCSLDRFRCAVGVYLLLGFLGSESFISGVFCCWQVSVGVLVRGEGLLLFFAVLISQKFLLEFCFFLANAEVIKVQL